MYEIIEHYIEQLIKTSTNELFSWNIEKIVNHKPMSWNYVDGCMFNSLIEYARISKKDEIWQFVKSSVDSFLDENGNIKTYNINEYSLDNICESKVLFNLWENTHDIKYRKAIELTYQQIIEQPRTIESNFWHKEIYPNQVWLDGFYMVMPFYVNYLMLQDDVEVRKKGFNDILKQYQNVHTIMFNDKKGLYYHGYDSSKKMFWADVNTGLSKNFWLRAIGWYFVSLVDVYCLLKETEIKKVFACYIKELTDGILKYKDSTTNMFYQIVDEVKRPDNYVETSGSAMISYAILKASRLGILDKSYQNIGQLIFDGICKKMLKEENNQLSLEGICLSAGLGPNDKPYRDGSCEYYLSEPIVKNDAKGIAPFIMAYIELKRILC